MYKKAMHIADFDPELYAALQSEHQRQEDHVELIASENFVSPRVLEAYASTLTNKYAEGYPGKRYYGGCEFVDIAESLAIERAKKLFDADYANVQPHSGSQANSAVYQALIEPNDTILGMSLASGGHLTHGTRVNFSGKFYQAAQYEVDTETGVIDYDQVAEVARECQPKLIIAGYSAYSRTIDWEKFREIADEVGAYLMADIAHIAGLIVTGLHPSPIGIADVVTTTTHKTLRGPRGGMILAKNSDNADLMKKLQSAIFPGLQGGPLMHVIAAKAVAFKEALQPDFITYQQQVIVNAQTMAETIISRGYDIVSGGTDNHLFLVDLRKQQLTGKDAEKALVRANITSNKNTVPDDPQSPFVTSGLRIGSPAMTTRGFTEKESVQVANWMCDVLDNLDNETVIADVKQQVTTLCHQFPIYEAQCAEILS